MTRYNRGFTLVELTLSMAFISMLLLAIALLTIQISSIYNKGLTLKSVNESGQLIASDMQRSLNASSPLVVRQVPTTSSTGGRLCMGSVVYAWNYGRDLGKTGLFNRFESKNGDIRMVKFSVGENGSGSPTTDYCELSGESYPPIPDSATELLVGQSGQLAIHEFSISPSGTGTGVLGDNSQQIYSVSMKIGTQEQEDIVSQGCNTVQNADDDYCAINQFDFTARAGNRDRSSE